MHRRGTKRAYQVLIMKVESIIHYSSLFLDIAMGLCSVIIAVQLDMVCMCT